MSAADLLRRLPSVARLKRHERLQGVVATPAVITTVCRAAIQTARDGIRTGVIGSPEALAARLDSTLADARRALDGPLLRRVLNGTGVLLHTNAGRAPLPQVALDAITASARGYSNLEFSLDTGRRGSRQDHVRPLLRWLTGAEDALVVNNGAAAVLLMLHALCKDRSVVVSRGELVEIGGGFRVPEVMEAAGCGLLEVGTTNRTHLRDFSRAIATGKAAGVLQVHRSNFALVGFVKTPPLADLATLAHDHGLPMLVDLGSGALAPLDAVRTGGGEGSERREPTVPEVLAGGADVVTFSGDKLIGGPQAGIIVGKRAFVQQLAGSAMARALRVCNLTLAGLEQVLRLHLQGRANEHLPVLAALVQGETEVDAWAHALAAALRARLGAEWSVAVDACEAEPGGGTDPLVRLPSRCLALQLHGVAAETLATAALRVAVPVIGRVRGDRWLLDVRTLKAGSPSAVAADGNALADELAVSLLHVRREIAEAAGASITAD